MTRITLLIPLLAVLLSCGQFLQSDNGSQTNAPAESTSDVGASASQPAVQPSVAQPPPMVAAPPPPPPAAAIPLPEAGDLLLEEKIIRYNTIVLATMASSSSEVVLTSDISGGSVDNSYVAILKFNLHRDRVPEGAAARRISRRSGLTASSTRRAAEAEAARAAIVQRRDTQWDDARAVVFLVGNHGGSVEWVGTTLTELLQRSDHYYLSDADPYYHIDDRYSLYSRSRILWFPEQRPHTLADGTCMMSPTAEFSEHIAAHPQATCRGGCRRACKRRLEGSTESAS